ncbi:glucose-6-phosphate isomerase [Paenisporosarcina antarctica]|uniref:Glucose-6-phosphate isomerase n=1 Tax=Paenisporosarcina antarctica TaxID=417367 RepID=A0A4P7A0B4_9BACL|nr:glucose-6-phosphate isomerase [Paenisporosarcina antarctica]QBP41819.1 glucose-6-phosphate isomerase [Paenisporosarcina antarctica]
MTIKVTYSGDYQQLISPEIEAKLNVIHNNMQNKTGLGSDYLGWYDWASRMNETFLQEIQQTADRIRQNSDVLVVIGIGGSYLGSKAVIEALTPHFHTKPEIEVIYAGHHVSGEYLAKLMKYLNDKEVTVNVISKSGTTTEPALAFRFLQKYMEDRYGEEAVSRIIVTTDAEKGSLLSLSKEKGYQRFEVPADIGGRYSVLTAVGLLPIAVAGHSIRDLVKGASTAEKTFKKFDMNSNVAIQYAVIRNHLYNQNYSIEILATFEPKLAYLQEWWKQLFGESEGKEQKGLFPASVSFSTDLHSLGQYIQDGQRILFESFLIIEETATDLSVFTAENNGDELNYLSGLTLNEFNLACYEATSSAHLSGEVPQIGLTIKELNEENIGFLLYFYMVSCAYSAYLLEINPFDQPGVEDYKTNIFKILQKPGFI